MLKFHERLNMYSRPEGDGGVRIDIETMMIDLITVAKCGGITREMLKAKVAELFDQVQLEMEMPKGSKN